MLIIIRKCDFCMTDYRNDQPEFNEFGFADLHTGERGDICPVCILKRSKRR